MDYFHVGSLVKEERYNQHLTGKATQNVAAEQAHHRHILQL